MSPPPDGWTDVSGGTTVLAGFLPTKTPIVGTNYTPRDVLASQHLHGQPIGMVISLCNTRAYYNPTEFTHQGVKWNHIPCRGYNQVPTEAQVAEFFHIVNEWWSHRPRDVIVIHCTHGLNRTGYFISRYLMATRGIPARQALDLFGLIRPPGIQRQHLHTSLLKALAH